MRASTVLESRFSACQPTVLKATTKPMTFFAPFTEVVAVATIEEVSSASSYAGILASNMVATTTSATIDNANAPSGSTISAAGNVTVQALDEPTISATSKLEDASSAANDGGVGILNSLANTLLDDYQYTSNSGSQNLVFGDRVRVASGY